MIEIKEASRKRVSSKFEKRFEKFAGAAHKFLAKFQKSLKSMQPRASRGNFYRAWNTNPALSNVCFVLIFEFDY